MTEPTVTWLGHQEITDDIAREKYGVLGHDKLIICRLMVNDRKCFSMVVVTHELISDSLIDWVDVIKANSMQQAQERYSEDFCHGR